MPLNFPALLAFAGRALASAAALRLNLKVSLRRNKLLRSVLSNSP